MQWQSRLFYFIFIHREPAGMSWPTHLVFAITYFDSFAFWISDSLRQQVSSTSACFSFGKSERRSCIISPLARHQGAFLLHLLKTRTDLAIRMRTSCLPAITPQLQHLCHLMLCDASSSHITSGTVDFLWVSTQTDFSEGARWPKKVFSGSRNSRFRCYLQQLMLCLHFTPF